MADRKAKTRANKLLELSGDSFYDPSTDKYINDSKYDLLRKVTYHAADADGRLDPGRLNRGELENSLQKWDNTPSLIRAILTPIIKNQLRSSFVPYSQESLQTVMPVIENARDQVTRQAMFHGGDGRLAMFMEGLKQRAPQIPTRVPALIDRINKPSDIDQLGDLRNYLLMQMQQRR